MSQKRLTIFCGSFNISRLDRSVVRDLCASVSPADEPTPEHRRVLEPSPVVDRDELEWNAWRRRARDSVHPCACYVIEETLVILAAASAT